MLRLHWWYKLCGLHWAVSTWTKEKLDQMIRDQVEENLTLEYKRAAALSKTNDRAKTEITKDRGSAMAMESLWTSRPR